MTEDQQKDFVTRRQELRNVLVNAAADFLEREGGLRFMDIRESFGAALQLLVVNKVAKVACRTHPSHDRLNDGQ